MIGSIVVINRSAAHLVRCGYILLHQYLEIRFNVKVRELELVVLEPVTFGIIYVYTIIINSVVIKILNGFSLKKKYITIR